MKPLLTGDARTVAEWVGRELDLAYTHQGWSLYEELLSLGVEKHQAAFSSGTWLTGTPLTYLAPW